LKPPARSSSLPRITASCARSKSPSMTKIGDENR
jgi:hypothetical protein